ncbi:MAG: PAS domain S-box protein [Gemmataceae bacterium]|nr:PAS domain S-box protein [Gemmataceae bacterium]
MPVLCGVFVAFGGPAEAAPPADGKLVVVLYSGDTAGSPAVVAADRGFRAVLAGGSAGHVEVRSEYVDTPRPGGPDLGRLQREYLRTKYAGRKVDLLVAVLSPALDFALEHRAELFPSAPLVFCAVEGREVAARTLPPDVAGVPMRVEVAATLDLALRLHPATRRVFVVAGSAPFDLFWEGEARREFRAFEGRLEFVYLTGLPMADLLARVADLPEGSVIYYLHVFRDGAGRDFLPADALARLSRAANAPVYGHSAAYIGSGAVGGRVVDFEREGGNAARVGLAILAGERPGDIPTQPLGGNADLFDWHQLRRWGVDEDRLPPGGVVRFREPTFWGEYRWHVAGAVALCVVQAGLIAALVVQLMKRRRADERFRRVVETAPVGILLVGPDGAVVMANDQAVRLFGYARGELLGRPVELLVPDRARDRHPADRGRYFDAPAVRPMGLGRELTGRRKDGREVPVEIGLSPLQTPKGLFVLASVVDLTERRRAEAEARASQRELLALPGRLLDAQEAERRRIARELHDDISQNLALLAVEMDLLAGPPSSAEAGVPARDLSARLKGVSSAVHDLSHQLHPSKLEQLGLVAAVRGLCQEYARARGLDVKFTHYGLPDRFRPEAELCLFRIVQEALGNVAKHSGVRHAAVELIGSPGEVRLRVADDGVGFDPTARGGRLGLASMRERVNLVGGEVVIDSRPGGGTRIDVRVPTAPAGEEGTGRLGGGVR